MIGVHRVAIGIEEDRPDGDLPLAGGERRLVQGKTHRFLEGGLGHRRYTKSLGGIA